MKRITMTRARSTERRVAIEQAVRSVETDCSESTLVNAVVAAVLAADGIEIDSHHLADLLYARRCTRPDFTGRWDQTKDYVQYVLREQPAHVCRHADGHHYRVHPEVSCGADCDEKYAMSQADVRRATCQTCQIEVTTSGRCSMGCDD